MKLAFHFIFISRKVSSQNPLNTLSTGLGFAIIDAIISDRKGRFVFRHFWRIIYLGHPILSSAFLKLKYNLNINQNTHRWFKIRSTNHYASGRGMSKDVSANRLFRICNKTHSSTRVSCHLICDVDGDIVLLAENYYESIVLEKVSDLSFCSRLSINASFCCLSANSPRPLKSTRNNALRIQLMFPDVQIW